MTPKPPPLTQPPTPTTTGVGPAASAETPQEIDLSKQSVRTETVLVPMKDIPMTPGPDTEWALTDLDTAAPTSGTQEKPDLETSLHTRHHAWAGTAVGDLPPDVSQKSVASISLTVHGMTG